MKNIRLLLACTLITLLSCKNEQDKKMDISDPVAGKNAQNDEVKIKPIEHATMILSMGEFVIYVDPTGGKKAFMNRPKATHILITDIHQDHFDMKTIKYVFNDEVKIIVPKAVAAELPEQIDANVSILEDGDISKTADLSIKAVPMYNLRKEALDFHPRDRGNGYVISWKDEKIYISGDTEDIPEMRNLEGITKAFVCMNMPYTMPIATAADAVLDFKPKVVYPYHYRGENGFSDVHKFANIIKTNNPAIQVKLLKWYKDEPRKKIME